MASLVLFERRLRAEGAPVRLLRRAVGLCPSAKCHPPVRQRVLSVWVDFVVRVVNMGVQRKRDIDKRDILSLCGVVCLSLEHDRLLRTVLFRCSLLCVFANMCGV